MSLSAGRTTYARKSIYVRESASTRALSKASSLFSEATENYITRTQSIVIIHLFVHTEGIILLKDLKKYRKDLLNILIVNQMVIFVNLLPMLMIKKPHGCLYTEFYAENSCIISRSINISNMIMTVVHVGLKLIVSVITSVAIGIKCERVVKSDQKTFQLFNPCSQKGVWVGFLRFCFVKEMQFCHEKWFVEHVFPKKWQISHWISVRKKTNQKAFVVSDHAQNGVNFSVACFKQNTWVPLSRTGKIPWFFQYLSPFSTIFLNVLSFKLKTIYFSK